MGTLDHALYSPRLGEALAFAAHLHRRQRRTKASPGEADVPYVAHLLETAALVMLGGGTEEQVIAGLLHDALEYQHHDGLEDEIADLFGDEVLRMVVACTDGTREERVCESGADAAWQRKLRLLEKMGALDDATLLVVAADKTSNARALVDDLEAGRPGVTSMFTLSWQQTLRYYAAVADLVEARLPTNLVSLRLVALVPRLARA
jgi:(p)ppGpp synthase/HD superfamily hydrolase